MARRSVFAYRNAKRCPSFGAPLSIFLFSGSVPLAALTTAHLLHLPAFASPGELAELIIRELADRSDPPPGESSVTHLSRVGQVTED